jgi:hypothetical protein
MTPKMLTFLLGLAAASAACSSSSEEPGDKIGGHPPMGGAANAGGSSFGGGFVTGSGGTKPMNPPDGATCASRDVAKEALPVDMYVMFDQSQSMTALVPNANPPVNWWQMAQQAVVQFVQDPAATGIGVGIQFFPYHGSVAGPDPNVPGSSCFAQNYATPEVPVALLPGNSGPLVQAIQSHAPTTFTPTAAALQGAVQYMQQWGPAHPGRQPVVVLVTDGYPTECDPQDPSLIAQIAQAAYDGTPRVMTFVVGFESNGALDNLQVIAKAGGSGEAFLISGGDIGKQFVQAMLGISTTPLDCGFDIPATTTTGDPIDLAQVWVEYVAAATGVPLTITQLANLGQCSSAPEGWYFDAPPPTSKKIMICPKTCSKFAAGSMHIKYGCRKDMLPVN